MGLRELLAELEHPPTGCDILDVDKLLRACQYRCYDDGETLLYEHQEWKSLLTFPRSKRTVPQSRLRDILEFVRWHLTREGKL